MNTGRHQEPGGHEESGGRKELGTVHHLPTPAGEVLDGEVVTEEEYQRLTSQRALARGRWRGYQSDVVAVAHAARTVAGHDRTRAVFRHALAYPVSGVGVVLTRWRDTHGASRYERQMRAAEAAGDQDAVRYWQEADVAEKARRHARVMDWIEAPAQIARAVVVGLLGLAGFLAVLGILLALHTGHLTDMAAPITTVLDAVAFTVWFLSAYGVLVLLAGTAGGVGYLYQQGRAHAQMPRWLTGPAAVRETDAMDELPDEGTIVRALHNLGIAGFNRALKEGWRIQFRQPPTVDGKGWRAQLLLPPACPVEEIVRRKTTLAHNLVRFPNEVWPTEPDPSVLDLWVAKPGALSGPVDPWPLLEDLEHASTDYFRGVPVGVTIRGDVVHGRLSEANYAIGGMMGSGKSTLVITLILGAMLDPLVEVDVIVMAENADYEPMKPRLRTLVTGAGQDTADTAMTMLAALYEELATRGRALREHDARSVTRAIAAKDHRLRPRIMVVDECQNLFIGTHGKAAIETTAKLISTARKYAIALIFLTPEPSKDALPRKILSITSNKACFAIGDQNANDAVLGTGSYKAGISAVGLTPKTDEDPGDIGTCMTRGFTPRPALLRSFYIPQPDAHRVTQRALHLRRTHPTAPTPGPAPTTDHLTDIATVLGDHPRMRTQEVLHRLAGHNRAAYRHWTFTDLRTALAAHDIEPAKSDGVMVVRASDITQALTHRDHNDPGGGDDDTGN